MPKGFFDILEIARDNVRRNPSIINRETLGITKQYLQGLRNEVEEVVVEVKDLNEIYLTDELSDIAWNYAVILALLEYRGLISSAEEVLEHGYDKYTERAPAFLEASEDMWDTVKAKQKEALKQRHQETYGN